MSQNDINSLIPQEAKDDLVFINGQLDLSVDKVKLLAKESQQIRFGGEGGKTLMDGVKAMDQSTKKVDELTVAMDEYKKLLDQLTKTQARLNTLESQHAKDMAVNKSLLQQRNQELKREAELQVTVNGSIDRARAVVKALTMERDKLDLTTEEGKRRQKEYNDEIDKQNAFIKENVDQYTQQKINIGNYSGALKILEGELTAVRKKIDDYTNSGNKNNAMLERLAREEALLTQLVENQANGFASATMELRNNEKALQALGAAGLQQTEFYQQLLNETAQLKDNVSDLKQEIKGLASDTKTIDGLVGAAQLLAGSYGIAVASAELFGDENEDLQKSMQKLQAVMTIMMGIQQIANALQKESSLMLFLNTVRLRIYTAAMWLYNYATNAATSATVALRSALIGLGLGTVLVLISSTAAAMDKWGESTEEEEKRLKKLNDQLKIQKKFSDDFINGYKKQSEKIIAQMEAEGASSEELRKQKELDAEEEVKMRKEVYDRTVANMEKFSAVEEKLRKKSSDLTNEEATQYIAAREEMEQASNEWHDAEDSRDKQLYDHKRARHEEEVQHVLDMIKLRRTERDFLFAAKKSVAEQNAEVDRAIAEGNESTMQEIVQGEKKTFEERVDALDRYTKASLKLINDQAEYDKKKARETADVAIREEQLKETDKARSASVVAQIRRNLAAEEKAIDEKAARDFLTLTYTTQKSYYDIIKTFSDQAQQYRIDALEKISNNNNRLQQDELNALNDRLAKGKLSVEKYNKEVDAVNYKWAKQSLQDQIDYLHEELKNESISGEQRLQLQDHIDKAKLAKEQLANEKTLQERQKLQSATKQLEQELVSTLTTLITEGYRRKADQQDKVIEGIEKEKQAEIDKINSTLMSEEDRAMAIAKIEAESNAKKAEADKKKRNAQRAAAEFEKAVAIAGIIVETAKAVMEALPNVPLSITVGAIGALQLTKALATRIPAYKRGIKKGLHPGGLAVLGDGYQHELIEHPDGSSELSAAVPTLYNLAPGTGVTPLSDIDDISNYMGMPVLAQQYGDNQAIHNAIRSAVEDQTKDIVSAIKNQPASTTNIDRGFMQMVYRRGNNTSRTLKSKLS